MPYKRKEDRTEAVRRYREKKKGLAVAGAVFVEDDETLGGFLRKLGFNEIPYEMLVEASKADTQDVDGSWHHADGKRFYPPKQVFFGWNTMIIGDDIG